MTSILKFVQNLNAEDLDDFDTIIESISDRLDFYEEREPEYSGETYDKWEEKRDATEDLLTQLQDMRDEIEDPADFDEDVVYTIQELIEDYQSDIGGLSRWF